MEPDPEVMMQFVLRLFGNQMTGAAELAWRDAKDGKVRHGQLFQLDDLDALVEKAAEINAVEGQNAYVGAALRKPEGPPFGRASDADVQCATAFWADLDTAEAVKTARMKSGNTPANCAVVTGRRPHPRAQLWWIQEQAVEDLDLLRRQNAAIAAALDGDRAVVNSGRIMRLAGSVAWPTKPGRIAELTELMTWPTRTAAYPEGAVVKTFPLNTATPAAAKAGLRVSQVFATASQPERWRDMVRDGVVEGTRNCDATALVGHLLRRNVDVDLVAEILRLWNAARCQPPLDDGELRSLFDSVCARELARRSNA